VTPGTASPPSVPKSTTIVGTAMAGPAATNKATAKIITNFFISSPFLHFSTSLILLFKSFQTVAFD
jgi:hypothetical protein